MVFTFVFFYRINPDGIYLCVFYRINRDSFYFCVFYRITWLPACV